MFTSRLALFVGVLISFASGGCGWMKNSNDAQNELAPGQFSSVEVQSLRAQPNSRFTVIALTPIGANASVAELVRKNGGTVRVADERTGVIIANLSGVDATKVAELNSELSAGAAATFFALDQVREYKAAFDNEKLNPDTGADNDPMSVTIDRTPTNAQLPTAEMGVLDFERQMKERFSIDVNGDSVKIAILDTGLDLAQKGVFQNRVKVSRDMTGEGDVSMSRVRAIANAPSETTGSNSTSTNSAQANSIEIVDRATGLKTALKLPPSLLSPTGTYYAGRLREASYTGGDNIDDLDQNGKNDGTFHVVLSKTPQGWRAAIDVNRDASFVDETVVRDYELSQDTLAMDRARSGLVRLAVNIPVDARGEIATGEDETVTLNISGFDGGQHGTHVAGIAAGRFEGPQFGGHFRGGAPYAQLMGLKVLGSGGGADSEILDGIVYAISKGAHVINMSLGSVPRPADGLDSISTAIDQIARRTDVIFVISAGNSGPSLTSLGSPSTAGRALSIGAYSSGATWRSAYNVPTAPLANFLWTFSSVGPMDTGEIRPTLVAPGAAYSSIPLARSEGGNTGYDIMQGTSMAAPAATGAIAALVDALHKLNGRAPLATDSLSIVWSLVEGAKDLNEMNKDIPGSPRYSRFEQGAGLLNLPGAFAALEKRSADRTVEYEVETQSLREGYQKTARGIYTATRLAERVTFKVRKRPSENLDTNEHNFDRLFDLSSSALWVSPELTRIVLNGINKTDVALKVDQNLFAALPPGAHHARISARNVENQQIEFVFDITYIKARELSETFNRSEFLERSLLIGPGAVKRYFFYVGSDRTRLNLSLDVAEFNDKGEVRDGRYTIGIFGPTGRKLWGSKASVRGSNPREEVSLLNPESGVYEVLVSRSFAAIDDTPAVLRFSTESLRVSPSLWMVQSTIANLGFITQTFTVTNSGRTLAPIAEVSVDTVGTVIKDVELVNREKKTLEFEVPKGVREITVSTKEVKGNTSADIDLVLTTIDGAQLGTSGNPVAEEKITAAVTPGMKLKLTIDAYDLLKEKTGKVDVAIDYLYSLELHGTTTLSKTSLATRQSLTITAALNIGAIPVDLIASALAAHGNVSLKGELRIFDKEPLVAAKVGSVPVLIEIK